MKTTQKPLFQQRHSGFSLIELTVIVLLIGILAAVLIPNLLGTSFKKDVVSCAGKLKRIGAAFQMYVMENNGYAYYNENMSKFGDNFFSYEALYVLGSYMGDDDHAKFAAGTWQAVRCPGNKAFILRNNTGNANVPEQNQARDQLYDGGAYYYDGAGATDLPWHNRQAPTNWSAKNAIQTSGACSIGQQPVDYQYNASLGGIIIGMGDRPTKATPEPPVPYRLNYIVKYPEETVVFCDIQWDLVQRFDNTTKMEHEYQYVYPWWMANKTWGAPPLVISPPGTTDLQRKQSWMRTNEAIHEGRGINAVFVDGHVEFLPGTTPYCGDGSRHNIRQEDDLLNWGLSYPVNKPQEPTRADQIGGVHGFRRLPPGWCIEHEDRLGHASASDVHSGYYGGGQDCFADGV